jgi:hypothetical protein
MDIVGEAIYSNLSCSRADSAFHVLTWSRELQEMAGEPIAYLNIEFSTFIEAAVHDLLTSTFISVANKPAATSTSNHVVWQFWHA